MVSDQVVIALETFATRCTFKLLGMDVHVPSVHLFVSEHQGTLVTGELLTLVNGCRSCDCHHLAS